MKKREAFPWPFKRAWIRGVGASEGATPATTFHKQARAEAILRLRFKRRVA